MDLNYRQAKLNDLPNIIALLSEDVLGQTREKTGEDVQPAYIEAFQRISSDPNQFLLVVEESRNIVGTCHLTLIPSLTFMGQTRMQIEAVRVEALRRGHNIGRKMIQFAMAWGKEKGATIFQLTSNKQRKDAIQFYEGLGFKATHEGMKLYLEPSK